MSRKIKFINGEMYEYEDKKLVDKYDPILKQVLPIFDFTNPLADPKFVAMSLIQTMVKHGGLGLAANQVGWPYRVFVMGAGNVAFACFNPEIIEVLPHKDDISVLANSEYDTSEEGCLSFLGLFLPVSRAKKIKVRYTDFNGMTKETIFEGITARVFQHELDHLNGITFTTKVSSIKLESAKRKVKGNLKKIERKKAQIAYVQKLQKLVQQKVQEQSVMPESSPSPQPFVLDTSKL